METIELVRLICYGISIIACFILSGYFFREFNAKKLRASLAWGLGFLLFGFGQMTTAFLATAEVSRSGIAVGAVFTAGMISLLYYGASLLFFREKSFFREKMAAVIFIVAFALEIFLAYIAPENQIAEFVRGPTTAFLGIIYFLIAVLFFRVSRRLPDGDPRRRTLSLVSAGWVIILIWNIYLGLFWGDYPSIESGVYIFGSFGYILLLYGMTTGKTTRT